MDETDSLVREHYQQHTLPHGRVTELAQMTGSRRRDWWRLVSVLATATCLVLAVTLIMTTVIGRPADKTVHEAMPRIVAVQFHADWCKPSRTISPRVEQLRDLYGDDGVLFVEVDLTTDKTRNQAEYLMTALGLEQVWTRQKGRTGELLLIDRVDNRVMNTFDQTHTPSLMAAVLDDALGSG